MTQLIPVFVRESDLDIVNVFTETSIWHDRSLRYLSRHAISIIMTNDS